MKPVRWGILSTARINDLVLPAFKALECAELIGVASRDKEQADAYARARGIPRAYGSYEALLRDYEIEAVYIPLPNSLHYEWTLRAFERGKAVLCEKPLAMTATEGEELFDRAARSGCLLMEAFMYRHHPQTETIRELVHGGAVGSLQTIRASLCGTANRERDIQYDRQLGGGALRDLGCYCIGFARLLAGEEPVSFAAHQLIVPSGVDERTCALLGFPSGVNATFDVSLQAPFSQRLTAVGSEGVLDVPLPFHPHFSLQPLTIRRQDNSTHEIRCPGRDSYELEIENLSLSLRGESELLVTRQDTIGNLRVSELVDSAAHRTREPGGA